MNCFQFKKHSLFLFYIISLCCAQCWCQNIEEIQFKHWSSKLGLAADEVTSFTQDNKGFLWIGTSKGLNRFDGDVFLTIEIDKGGLHLKIKELLSYKKSVYVYTNDDKLFKINTDDFSQEQIKINNLGDGELKRKLLQISTRKIEIYNGDSFKLTDLGSLYRNGSEIQGAFNNIYKDSRHRLWISSVEKGIGYWNSRERKINYVIIASELTSLYPNVIELQITNKVSIVEDKTGRVWFHSARGIIGFWDYEMDIIYTIKNIKSHPYLEGAYKLFSILIDTEIRSLFADDSGNLWIGTLLNGMFRCRFRQQRIQFYEFDYSSKIGLADEDVSSPIPLKNGDIWIGTWGGGINILKKENLKASIPDFEVVSPQKGMKGALQSGFVFPLFEDSKENIWVGTDKEGLHFLSNKNRKSSKFFFSNYNKSNGVILSDSIMDIYEDSEKTIWIATFKGLTRYLPEEKIFESKFNELRKPNIFKDIYILSLFEDSNDNLWVSTKYEGLYKWNKKNNLVTKIKNFNTYTANSILNIVEGSKKTLWFVGLNGLFYYNLYTDTIGQKVISKDLPTDHIESIIYGNDGLLWLGTDKGLFAYDPIKNDAVNITLPVGIRNKHFTRGVSKDIEGYLYFGTRNGFYRFHPDRLNAEKTTVPVFTDLKIDGVSYRNIKKGKLINNDISVESKINLNYDENTFSLSYKNLDYQVKDVIFYETSMIKEGEKDSWTTTFDTYKSWINLSEGNYTFKVRNSNESLISEINIIITPPWWRTRLAILGCFILLCPSIYFLIYYYTKKAIVREKKTQNEKFDKLRFKFFLNIAHEIRTPLTLIKGGVERLKEENAVSIKYIKELNRVYKNTDRLSRLVNEVLDLKKIERTSVSLNLSTVNLKWFLENIIDVFKLRENEANLIFKTPKEPIWVISDKQLLESIFYNLISNAIKYSESNAKIEVSLFSPKENEVSIQVKDNGLGIKKEEQILIFERLYQSSEHLKTGTGIGLAIVKQYVSLLKGSINLKSNLNVGSIFTVTFPYTKIDLQIGANGGNENIIIPKKKFDSSILIIDDQKELRTFIKEIFEKEYYVFEASNGEEGLELVLKHLPSLIISDVMMPVMNGIEFCKKVRNNLSVSHIPVILLTAKTGDEIEIDSLSSGADAYVNKPFNQKILKSRAYELIENRKNLIKKYSLYSNEDLTVLASNNVDKKFLKQLEILLEKCHEYSDLSIEELASEMAVSASGFYKKIKSITGSSPVEFVRTYRLKKAAQLLKTTNLSVTEISEKTGFGTQKYFSNSFKKHYGVTPLTYRKE